MPGNYTHEQRLAGSVLTAAQYNMDHQQHVNNRTPEGFGPGSTDLVQFRATKDPGGAGTEVRPTSVWEEILEQRHVLHQIGEGQYWYTPKMAAVAPTVTIAPVESITAGDTHTLVATVEGGTYDALAYDWVIVSGGGTLTKDSDAGSTADYERTGIMADVNVEIKCTVTATGDGTTAKDGTSDTAEDTEEFIVVAETGNEQTIALPASAYMESPVAVWWNIPSSRPLIDTALTDPATLFTLLASVVINADGSIQLSFSANDSGSTAGSQDLSDTWETSGGFDLTVGTFMLSVDIAGVDTLEPYEWTPSNSAEVTAFYNNVFALTGNQAATLVLRDR